jgi:glutamate-1-semialdehyde 2,1-aminomutase
VQHRETVSPWAPLRVDWELRTRAQRVIPGGMYGHQSVRRLPVGFPQFMSGGHGARVRDADGREYVDFMCSYGPVVVGHHHPDVDQAAAEQASRGDCLNGPAPVMVELAEKLVDMVSYADWAMFQKNGTDATTLCCTIARAATGRRKILVAEGAYHGSAPWCTPVLAGVTPEDRANVVPYRFNDLASVEAALAAAAGDVAGILVTPFRHDAGYDQELVDPAFAQGLRRLCDRVGAPLILDEVRCGLRLALGSSWDAIGVQPDLSAWSKALGNGYPIAAVLGIDALRDAAASVFVTGSFWFAAVPMAAASATLDVMQRDAAVERMVDIGKRFRQGLAQQAEAAGFTVHQTGPVQMPYLSFDGDSNWQMIGDFCLAALQGGVYLHPRHNWFVSAATTEADLDQALAATDRAFQVLRAKYGG